MSLLASFGRWLNLKQYQFEVTFSVYMFTPLEKFVICTLGHFLASPPSLDRSLRELQLIVYVPV